MRIFYQSMNKYYTYYIDNINAFYDNSLIIISDNNSKHLDDIRNLFNSYNNVVFLVNESYCKFELGGYKIGIQYILQNNAHININLDNFNIFVQQYELKKNTIDNITLEEYNSLVIDLNIWIQEYKDNNGKTINITVFDSFLNSLNLYLQQYSQQNNIVINLDDLNIESITTNFINGKIAVEVYFNYLSRIFINSNNDYLNNLLLGIYPLIPVDKAFYLKNYANKINSYGSVWNHYNKNRPTSNNFNFLKYF